MASPTNQAFLKLQRRAEGADREKLVKTFVDAGPLFTLLSSQDHQVIYGRRGTGKTHALIYLGEDASRKGDVAIYVDFRTIGSTGGLYADTNIPLSQRATRLLVDTLLAIHEAMLTVVLERDEELNLGVIGPLLDDLAQASTQVIVSGPVQDEQTTNASSSTTAGSSASLKLEKASPSLVFNSNENATRASAVQHKIVHSGTSQHRVHFGTVAKVLGNITASLRKKRLWLLFDEFSTVPLDLQPYLADLLRRALLPVGGVTVKIGAIEQRTNFKITAEKGDYIGMELGADISADVNLDDFMVFDNDSQRATTFFRELFFRHCDSVFAAEELQGAPRDATALVRQAFTQQNVFEELVRAAEGVPRDAINIASIAAQKAVDDPISTAHVRVAAKAWYQRDKEAAMTSNKAADNLLHWIVDEVIAHRRARAFLLRNNVRHELIDVLFDSRLLHLLKRNIAAHDQPGVRYDVYKIDYGCYVDLLTTAKAPEGLLPMVDEDESASFVDVPPDDYRAIRTAILDLEEFEESNA